MPLYPKLTFSNISGNLATAQLPTAQTWPSSGTVQVSSSLTAITTALDLQVGQIAFPATQSASAGANTLDDYEEGTWTAALASGGGAITINSSDNTGSYTKIGRQVTVTGQFLVTSVASPTGALTMTGLPFASADLSQLAGRCAGSVRIDGLGATATTMIQAWIGEASSTINFEKYAAGSAGNIADQVSASTTIMVTLTYFAT